MRAFRNPRLRWVDDVRIGPKPIGYEGVEWINLVQDRDQWPDVVNMVMKFQVP
jgi:hypothetical protein